MALIGEVQKDSYGVVDKTKDLGILRGKLSLLEEIQETSWQICHFKWQNTRCRGAGAVQRDDVITGCEKRKCELFLGTTWIPGRSWSLDAEDQVLSQTSSSLW